MNTGQTAESQAALAFDGWLSAQSTPAAVTNAQSLLLSFDRLGEFFSNSGDTGPLPFQQGCCLVEMLVNSGQLGSEDALLVRGLAEAERASSCTVSLPGVEFLDVTMTPQFSADGLVARLWTFEDRTSRHRENQHHEHSLKMQAITRFAAGMAHEFNNLLTAVLGNLELLRMYEQHPVAAEGPSSHIESAEVAALRASQLIHELRKFASRDAPSTTVQSIVPVIRRVRKILSGISSERISVSHLFDDEDDLHGDIDADNLEDALLKFGLNSIESIGSATGHIQIHADIGGESGSPGELRIRITDDGEASLVDHPDAAFEPFAARQNSPQSTGLGMAMGYRLIEEMSGITEQRTEPGNNELMIKLPAAHASGKPTKPDSGIFQPQKTLRIAVVESDASIRRIARGMLRLLGHKTLTFEHGDSFLEAVDGGQVFDLIILANVMPNMSGKRTYEDFRSRATETPVIICSGRSINLESFCQESDTAPDGFLPKPFSMTDLSAILAVYT